MNTIRRIQRASFFIGTLAIFALTAPAIQAQTPTSQTKEPYTQERFEALQAQGALILVDIFAPWCPDCALQQTALSQYRERNPNVVFHTLVVDFDNQKEVVTAFRAPRQSTLILYKGSERLWFAVAETRPDVIARALSEGAGRR